MKKQISTNIEEFCDNLIACGAVFCDAFPRTGYENEEQVLEDDGNYELFLVNGENEIRLQKITEEVIERTRDPFSGYVEEKKTDVKYYMYVRVLGTDSWE